jgi:hypothetical protein
MSITKNYRIITIGLQFPWSSVGVLPIFSMILYEDCTAERLESILEILKVTKTDLKHSSIFEYDKAEKKLSKIIQNITTDMFLQKCGNTLDCNFWKNFEDTNFVFCRKVDKLQRIFTWNEELDNHEILEDLVKFLS